MLDGFPIWQIVVVSVMRLSEPLSFTSLFPYIYFMIRDFHIAPTEADISRYSGYMAASFAFFQFLFAVHWGKTSDRIGRKPVLMIGLLGTSVCVLVFGFSTNYYMALAARSLAGVLNGNVAVLRTTIGEICHEKRHQALGFSTFPFLFNLGSVLGPLIGGSSLFTQPPKHSPYDKSNSTIFAVQMTQNYDVKSFSSVYTHFRKTHPYTLSNIMVTLFIWFSCCVGFLFLEETNEKFKNRRDIGVEIGDSILHLFGIQTKPRPWKVSPEDEETPLLISSKSAASSVKKTSLLESEIRNAIDSSEDNSDVLPPLNNPTLGKAIVRRYSQSSATIKPKERRVSPKVAFVILSNCILGLHNVAYNEFLPVFLAARIHKSELKFPFSIVGGFGLDTSTIGTLFSSTGIMGMLIIFFIFPQIDRKLGTLSGYRFSLLIFPWVYFLVPIAIFTLKDYNTKYPDWLTVVCLYTLTSLKTLAQSTGSPQVFILLHRSSPKQHRAYVNSLTMSMVALTRCLGPIFFGYVMSLGDVHHIAWLSWWLMSALAFGGFVQTLFMTDPEE